jgi:hypothetical protein
MKSYKIVILILSIIICSKLSALIIDVNMAGTADYTVIQDAINASVDGDTIRVYPGHYIENINFSGKNIVVASLYHFTGEDHYKTETIIDGDNQSSVVVIRNGESRAAVLSGFTLTGGSGFTASAEPDYAVLYGGGIYIQNSSPTILDCIIEGNRAGKGGGIYIRGFETQANMFLAGITIRNNLAWYGSGGIYIHAFGFAEFSEINRCNIYDNYASRGLDFYYEMNDFSADTLFVYLDTVSVNTPTPLHYHFSDENYSLDWQNYKRETIEQDIYVSPSGDNSNSGTSPDEPFRNLHIAFSLIRPSAENPLTLHIDAGEYGPNINGDLFPLPFQEYTTYSGAGMDETIFNAEYETTFGRTLKLPTNELYINGITFTQSLDPWSTYGLGLGSVKGGEISDVKFLNNKINTGFSALYIGDSNATPSDSLNYRLKNVIFDGNQGNYTFSIRNCEIYAENLIVRNNGPYLESTNDYMGWLHVGNSLKGYYNYYDITKMTFVNCHFYDNYALGSHGATNSLMIGEVLDVKLINCTFADNQSEPMGSAIVFNKYNSTLEIDNCIFYNNGDNLAANIEYETNTLIVRNSLFPESEIASFQSLSNIVDVNVDEESVIFGNPQFIDDEENPHHLSNLSPAVNTGTTAYPEGFVFPEYCLDGNDRVIAGEIDMGCYESSFTIASEDEMGTLKFSSSNYPNPFNPTTTISFSLPTETNVELAVYNIRGQKVKDLAKESFDKGQHNITWNGKDNNEKPVATGVYFYKLKADKKVINRKMLLVK